MEETADSFLARIKPPRLEDAGLEDCALPADAIREAFLKAAAAVKSVVSAADEGDESEGRCVEDPWEESSNALVGITEGVTGPSQGCESEKSTGLTEAPGDKLVVGSGGDVEAKVDTLAVPRLPESGEACVDGLHGLKIGTKTRVSQANDADEDEESDGRDPPTLAEGYAL